MKRPIIDFKKLIYSKKFLITASVIISIVIWFVAMIERNPIRDQLFTDVSVNITVDDTSAQTLGLGIVSDISAYKFNVKISGPNYIVSTVKNTDFLLSASVDEVNAPGTYSLNVTGIRNSDVTGYSFVSIEPSKVDVTFDYIDTKTFDITPKIVGVSALDGLIAETPIISNKEQKSIIIKGPRELMKKIDSVGSLTQLSKNTVLSSTETYDSDIVLFDGNGDVLYRYDQSGNIYDGNENKTEGVPLSLSFTSIKVTQPISKKATLDVKIKFTNLPSGMDNADMLSVSVDHGKASVIGTPEVVSKMTDIELSPIDFRNVSVSASGKFEVSAALPDGVKLADNIEFFTVSIDLGGFSEKTFSISDVKYRGLGDGLSVWSPKIKNVKICGPKDDIAKIKASDIYAEIDLSGKTVGEHTSDVLVKSSKYNTIWQVGEYTCAVSISNKQ